MPLPTGLILPRTVREFKLSWNNQGRIGYFTASSQLNYGTDKQRLEAESVGFWIVPWLPAVALLVVLTAIVLFVARTRRRWSAAWKVLRAHDKVE